MTDEELLMNQLRNPPVMSMALNRDHLYKMMAESMNAAADRIEKLLLEITLLNTTIDMLHVAWDQTTVELSELKEKSNSDMGWELNPDRMGGQFTEEEINRGNEWR